MTWCRASAGVDRAEMEAKLEDASKEQLAHASRVALLEKAVVRAKKHKVVEPPVAFQNFLKIV